MGCLAADPIAMRAGAPTRPPALLGASAGAEDLVLACCGAASLGAVTPYIRSASARLYYVYVSMCGDCLW